MKYIIYDWAGNKPFGDMLFDDFDDAWGKVYEYLDTLNLTDEEFDENCGEYFVEETKLKP